MRVAVLDYGAGNLHSLAKALEAGEAVVTVTPSWSEAVSMDALVLPGVGSFGAAVASLGQERGGIRRALESGLPTLGICLGMQLLFEDSEEGAGLGIGYFAGSVRRLRARVVPQMGWNDVVATDDPLFEEIQQLVAYYANSYVCDPVDPSVVIASTEYEGHSLPAAVRKGCTWGVQFHPEKSSQAGVRLIRNFLNMARSGPGGR